MIGKIAPLVQGSKRRRIVIVHVLGGLAGGALAGVLFALVGATVRATFGPMPEDVTTGLIAAILVALALMDLGIVPSVFHWTSRQTPGSWTCALGDTGGSAAWGLDLGFGISTRSTFQSWFALPAYAVLVGTAAQAVIVFATFGLLRSGSVGAASSAPGDAAARCSALSLHRRHVAAGVAALTIAVGATLAISTY